MFEIFLLCRTVGFSRSNNIWKFHMYLTQRWIFKFSIFVKNKFDHSLKWSSYIPTSEPLDFWCKVQQGNLSNIFCDSLNYYDYDVLLLERTRRQNAESADVAFRLGITQMPWHIYKERKSVRKSSRARTLWWKFQE